jgi:hypothetical protein
MANLLMVWMPTLNRLAGLELDEMRRICALLFLSQLANVLQSLYAQRTQGD